MTILITGYLNAKVQSNKDRLARQSKVALKEIIAEAGGKMKTFEVCGGDILVDVDSDKTSSALIAKFAKLEGVKAMVLESLQAILHKSRMMASTPDKAASPTK